MHFRCYCGYDFHDSSDFLRFKGHIIADQDLDDFDKAVEDYHISKDEYLDGLCNMRTVYQCPHCGIVYINNADNELAAFVPSQFFDMNSISDRIVEDPDKCWEKNCSMLQSAKGELWRGWLEAEWNDAKNDREDIPLRRISVTLNSNQYDSYNKKYYDSLEELKADFIRLSEELASKNLIRSARFTVNGKAVAELCRNY